MQCVGRRRRGDLLRRRYFRRFARILGHCAHHNAIALRVLFDEVAGGARCRLLDGDEGRRECVVLLLAVAAVVVVVGHSIGRNVGGDGCRSLRLLLLLQLESERPGLGDAFLDVDGLLFVEEGPIVAHLVEPHVRVELVVQRLWVLSGHRVQYRVKCVLVLVRQRILRVQLDEQHRLHVRLRRQQVNDSLS